MSDEEFNALDRLLIGVLRRIALMERLTIGGTELTLAESFLIRELDGFDELSQQALAERLQMDKSRVSRVATALEDNGWVERHRDDANRRQYKVRLTADGRRLAKRMLKTVRDRHAQLFKGMTVQERGALERGLRAMHRGFDAGAFDALHEKGSGPTR